MKKDRKKPKDYTPSIETCTMNYLDMKIQGMNEYVNSLKRLGIYVSLGVNYPGQIYLQHFAIKELPIPGKKD